MTVTAANLDRGTDARAGAESSAVPLSRLVRVELRKITDTRSGRWLLIAIAVLTAAAITVFLVAADETDLTFDNFLAVTGSPQGFLLPVLGILAITSEWSQRTGLVTFTLEPSRVRVVVAKFIAMVALGLAAVALAYALAAVGNELGIVLRDGNGSWHYSASWVGEITTAQLIGIIQGLAFGMLLMSSAAAIVVYYVVPIAWSILFGLVSALQSAAPWVDINTATMPLFNHGMGAREWLQLAATVGIWVMLPLVVGAFRLLRSEVK